MRIFRTGLALIVSAALAISPALAASSHAKKHATTHASKGTKKSSAKAKSSAKTAVKAPSGSKSKSGTRGRSSRKKAARLRGQQSIDSARITEIQQALIRVHYLDAEPSGRWDSSTQAAMQHYQSDHGWQTRLMPDSRALKTLGLGPDYSDAINAKGANFGGPAAASDTTPAQQASGFTAASGVKN